MVMGAVNKDSVLGASLVLSVVSLVLLLGVTWYFQTSLNLLQPATSGVWQGTAFKVTGANKCEWKKELASHICIIAIYTC